MDRKEYWAHTPPPGGKPQLMEDHLRAVAELARSFGEPFGAGELAYFAGWLHDIGKFSDEFQKYMLRCVEDAKAGKKNTHPKGGDHMSAGAHLASGLTEQKINDANYLILGHHGGMRSRSDSTIHQDPKSNIAEAIERAKNQIPQLNTLMKYSNPPAAGSSSNERIWLREHEFFLRMAFSCLVDADSLDTEKHFDQNKAAIRERTASLEEWKQALYAHRAKLQLNGAKRTANNAPTVNRVRQEVFDLCIQAGEALQGVFTLAVPTGGGKTIASLAFALEHATHQTHPLRRIIYAIPYTSIIDQTAKVFAEVIGDEAPLLVHHSALPDDRDNNKDIDQTSWSRLASQNWDAPLVVTTTVQLFESLFSNSPSRCRKLHNIANSVIILDEAQMLPVGMLKPILEALNLLVKFYGSTVVICTATQPAFEVNSPHLKGLKNTTPIIPLLTQQKHFQEMKRVDFKVEIEPKTWEQVAGEIHESPEKQCLAIVNTRRDALALFDALKDQNPYHLSTLLCGAHRNAVLEEIRALLKAKKPCLLVSTQVIECGVDVDFARVYRAIGPLDRMVQAAGRCNREGERESGEVILFTSADGKMPKGEYSASVQQTLLMLKSAKPEDFHDPEFYKRYFETLYGETGAIDTDKKGIQKLRSSLDFPQVASEFRMIDQDTVPVLVEYPPKSDRFNEIYNAAKNGKLSRSDWRNAQPILVNLYRWEVKKHIGTDQLITLIDGALYAWKGEYDDKTGLVGIFGDPADGVYEPGYLIA